MRYRPLDKTKNEIRVLKFLHISDQVSTKDTIQCSIRNVSLQTFSDSQSYQDYLQKRKHPIAWDKFTDCVDLRDSTLEQTRLDQATSIGLHQNLTQRTSSRYAWGDFEALSYTWGDAGDRRRIHIDGIRKYVPQNLEVALRALRDLKETRLGMCYWVVSLCIDQGNLEERNEQVKRMRDVYGQARAVIVWLGEEEKLDRTAVQTMRHLCRSPNAINTLHLPTELFSNEWSALFAFMQKPYWNRCWIIRELAMNHNSTLFLCGKSKLTRRMIRLGANHCQELLQVSEDCNYQFGHDLDLGGWDMASRVHRLASLTFNPDVELGLDKLLNLVRRADATDKRDKVYSILGLLNPSVSANITPNYSLPVQQVYRDFMKSVIKASGRLDQIVFGGIPAKHKWPSWVPDWREPFHRHHIKYLRSRQASGNLPVQFRFLKKDKRLDRLVCRGFQVDTVDGIAAEPPLRSHPSQSHNASDRYKGRRSEAIQRTLLMAHPGSTGDLILEVPWTSTCDTYVSPANSDSSWDWLKLFQSSYFKRFDNFRIHNKDFCIGGQKFQTFFPQSNQQSVDIAFTLRCMRLALLSLDYRVLITTRTGYLGLAPIAVRSGDVVAILFGCNCPVVLTYNGNLYHVIGECYIHELMDGEILSRERSECVSEREFVLC